MSVKPFKPMLALDAGKLRTEDEDPAGIPAALRFPAIGQEKLDGIRVSIVGGKALTRKLKEIPNREIFDALSRPGLEGLDGEIIVGDPTAEDCYRRTASFAMAQSKTGEPWSYYVFDKWDAEGGFRDRQVEAGIAISRFEPFPSEWAEPKLRPVLSVDVADAAKLEEFEAATVAAGYEGVIVRDPDQPYKFGRGGKRDQSLVKLKRFIDFEAEVIGVYEEMHNGNEAVTNALGRTERSTRAEGKIGKGTLGGFVLRALNGPCEGMEFRCGTGFDASDRLRLWAESYTVDPQGRKREGLNGRIAKVKSFPVGVKEKPRHPVFLGFRDMEHDG